MCVSHTYVYSYTYLRMCAKQPGSLNREFILFIELSYRNIWKNDSIRSAIDDDAIESHELIYRFIWFLSYVNATIYIQSFIYLHTHTIFSCSILILLVLLFCFSFCGFRFVYIEFGSAFFSLVTFFYFFFTCNSLPLTIEATGNIHINRSSICLASISLRWIVQNRVSCRNQVNQNVEGAVGFLIEFWLIEHFLIILFVFRLFHT